VSNWPDMGPPRWRQRCASDSFAKATSFVSLSRLEQSLVLQHLAAFLSCSSRALIPIWARVLRFDGFRVPAFARYCVPVPYAYLGRHRKTVMLSAPVPCSTTLNARIEVSASGATVMSHFCGIIA
jgi:hypothetical protein